jgi:dTDP-4-amino-4,6-dideoxygalactose transaminase
VSAPPLIPLFDLVLSDEDVDAAAAAMRSGWLTMGPRCEELERSFAAHLGTRHAVALSSGTAALHLAYLAAGVRPGDEVIVPAVTFVATAAAVRYCGARPVLADIGGRHDLGIDPASVEARITPRTKAVCAMHYAGYAADVETLRDLCRAHDLTLIEDAAHSPSASTRPGGPKLGSWGLASAFSFFSNKVLSCGEGGLLATNADDVAATARSLRSHALTSTTWDRHRGHAPGYDVTGLGFNYRLDEPRAALLTRRMRRMEAEIASRRTIVHRYRELLAGVPGLTVPYTDAAVDCSSCYVMPVVLDDPGGRAALRARLLERHRVQTSVLYPALHELTEYADLAGPGLERASFAGRAELTLPLYPHLTAADQDRVVDALSAELAPVAAGRA